MTKLKTFRRISVFFSIASLTVIPLAGCNSNTAKPPGVINVSKNANSSLNNQSGNNESHVTRKVSNKRASQIKTKLTTTGLTIAQENRLPGTTAWRITRPAHGRIQGYASLDSVNQGGKLTFYVSTWYTGTLYNIKIFRMGYYQGKGGRLMKTTPLLKSRAQGWWNSKSGGHHLPQQKNPKGFLHLNWKPSYQLKVPPSWVSGYYLALLTDAHGYQSYIPFIVRSDTQPHEFLVDVPVNTWQAYNYWGDWSFYGHYAKTTRKQKGYAGNNAIEVSFNRPYSADNGAGLTFLEYPTVYWMEKEGYNVSYTTSVALDEGTTQWTPKGFISVGHDEYWTGKMRNRVTHMLNSGVNLAFLGANDMYWKVRYSDNHRTLIGYRWESKRDPLRGTPEQTGGWRYIGNPESTLVGQMYQGQPRGDNATWSDPNWIVSDPSNWLYKGLHVYKGEAVRNIIGWEYDSALSSTYSRKALHNKNDVIISASPVIDRAYKNKKEYMTTSIYKAKSGAYVFDAGTIWWGYGLSNPMHYQIYEGIAMKKPDYVSPSPIIQGVTRNLLNRFMEPAAKV